MAKKTDSTKRPSGPKGAPPAAGASMAREACGAMPSAIVHGDPPAARRGRNPKARGLPPAAVAPTPTAIAPTPTAIAPTPTAVALGIFDRAARDLALHTDDRLKLLNLGRTKLFEALKDPDPHLDVDQADRLGYFLAIYELSGRLVGSSSAWLKSPNSAPLFGGEPPLERMLGGRMADLIDTLTYLKGVYGGWA